MTRLMRPEPAGATSTCTPFKLRLSAPGIGARRGSVLAMYTSVALVQSDVNRLASNAPRHRGDHRRARLRRRRADRGHIEQGVEGEELEHVMVWRAAGRRARAAIVRAGHADLART